MASKNARISTLTGPDSEPVVLGETVSTTRNPRDKELLAAAFMKNPDFALTRQIGTSDVVTEIWDHLHETNAILSERKVHEMVILGHDESGELAIEERERYVWRQLIRPDERGDLLIEFLPKNFGLGDPLVGACATQPYRHNTGDKVITSSVLAVFGSQSHKSYDAQALIKLIPALQHWVDMANGVNQTLSTQLHYRVQGMSTLLNHLWPLEHSIHRRNRALLKGARTAADVVGALFGADRVRADLIKEAAKTPLNVLFGVAMLDTPELPVDHAVTALRQASATREKGYQKHIERWELSRTLGTFRTYGDSPEEQVLIDEAQELLAADLLYAELKPDIVAELGPDVRRRLLRREVTHADYRAMADLQRIRSATHSEARNERDTARLRNQPEFLDELRVDPLPAEKNWKDLEYVANQANRHLAAAIRRMQVAHDRALEDRLNGWLDTPRGQKVAARVQRRFDRFRKDMETRSEQNLKILAQMQADPNSKGKLIADFYGAFVEELKGCEDFPEDEIIVATSHAQLRQWGMEMGNCIASYSADVSLQGSILLGVYTGRHLLANVELKIDHIDHGLPYIAQSEMHRRYRRDFTRRDEMDKAILRLVESAAKKISLYERIRELHEEKAA